MFPRKYLNFPRKYLNYPRKYLNYPRKYSNYPRKYLNFPMINYLSRISYRIRNTLLNFLRMQETNFYDVIKVKGYFDLK